MLVSGAGFLTLYAKPGILEVLASTADPFGRGGSLQLVMYKSGKRSHCTSDLKISARGIGIEQEELASFVTDFHLY